MVQANVCHHGMVQRLNSGACTAWEIATGSKGAVKQQAGPRQHHRVWEWRCFGILLRSSTADAW